MPACPREVPVREAQRAAVFQRKMRKDVLGPDVAGEGTFGMAVKRWRGNKKTAAIRLQLTHSPKQKKMTLPFYQKSATPIIHGD